MHNLSFLFSDLLCIISVIVPLLVSVAFLTLFERKILAGMQRRLGPNVVGFLGLLQPFADGIKLLIKETIFPNAANMFIFILGPIVTLVLSIISWVVIPFYMFNVISDIKFGLLYIFAISSLGVYGILMAGWSSNSKYAFLGALRSAAQMVSYEVSIGIILLSVIFLSTSFNLTEIVVMQEINWNIIIIFPIFIMFLISILAETNRTPFDLPEAEGELVAGYNVEYSSAGFAFFFISEYLNIILMSLMVIVLFLGGWLPLGLGVFEKDGLFFLFIYFLYFINILFLYKKLKAWLIGKSSLEVIMYEVIYAFFCYVYIIVLYNLILFVFYNSFLGLALKSILVMFFIIWVRASVPRYRYNQLMRLGWKVLLPLSLSYLIFLIGGLFIYITVEKMYTYTVYLLLVIMFHYRVRKFFWLLYVFFISFLRWILQYA